MAHAVYTRDGAPVCHAVGCRKRKRLHRAHGGVFCAEHVRALGMIRGRLQHAKAIGDIVSERRERQAEIEFRKLADAGHMHWQRGVEENALKGAQCRATE